MSNLGEIKPRERQRKKQPAIPRVLSHGKALRFNIPHDEAVAVFGLWAVRALKDVMVSGRLVPAGSEFQLPGNSAVILAHEGDIVFIDRRLEEEHRVLVEAERLGLNKPVNIKEIEAFQPKHKKWSIKPE